jgi:hypothetical protein
MPVAPAKAVTEEKSGEPKLLFQTGRGPVRKPVVKVTKKWVTVNIQYPYDIRIDRIDTPLKLLNWVEHLSHKTWMDGPSMAEFVQKVCRHFGWDLFHPYRPIETEAKEDN